MLLRPFLLKEDPLTSTNKKYGNWLLLTTDFILPIYSVIFYFKSSWSDPSILAMLIIASVNIFIVFGLMCVLIPVTINSGKGFCAYADFYDQLTEKYYISTALRLVCGFPNLVIQALSFLGPTDGVNLVQDSRWWIFLFKLVQFSLMTFITMYGKNHGSFTIGWVTFAQWIFLIEMMSLSYMYILCNPNLYGAMMVVGGESHYTNPTNGYPPYEYFPPNYYLMGCQPDHIGTCYATVMNITALQNYWTGAINPVANQFTPGCLANNNGSTTFNIWSKNPNPLIEISFLDDNSWDHGAMWYINVANVEDGMALVFNSYYGTKLNNLFWFLITLIICQAAMVTISLWADLEKKLEQNFSLRYAFITEYHGFGYWLVPTCGLCIIYWLAFLKYGALDFPLAYNPYFWGSIPTSFNGFTKISNCYDDIYWHKLIGLVAVSTAIPFAILLIGLISVMIYFLGSAIIMAWNAFCDIKPSHFERITVV